MNGMTFVNTPGYYYSIAYFLAAFLVNRANKQRDDVKGWKRWIIHIVFFGGIVGFMELTDGVRQMLFIPCMMVSISMLLFYIYLCCDLKMPDTIAPEHLFVESLPHLCVGRSISILLQSGVVI